MLLLYVVLLLLGIAIGMALSHLKNRVFSLSLKLGNSPPQASSFASFRKRSRMGRN